MRPSTLSVPVLLLVVLLPACDSPSKDVAQPSSAPVEVGSRTAEPAAKALPPEVKDAAGAPSGAVGAARPPTDAAPIEAEPAPVGPADATPSKTELAPAGSDAAPKAKAPQPSAPEASTARKRDEGRPAKAFTDCRSSEAFADGHCYASREAACEALSCAGKCVHTRSMPPQVVCG